MRRSAFAFVVAVGMGAVSQSSNAAELLRKAPAVVAAYDWSGFYVGANFGYGHANADWTNRGSTALFADYLPGESFSHAMDGLIGGGQIGYNYQRGRWVFGVEAMFDVSAISGKQLSSTLFGAGDDWFEARISALAVASGRLGYAWDNVLAYGKAGFAFANIRASVDDVAGVNTGSGSDSQWRSGPAFGLGVEYGVTPDLSIGIEFDYIRLDSGSYQLGGGAGSYLWDVDVSDICTAMVRLNYRFAGLR